MNPGIVRCRLAIAVVMLLVVMCTDICGAEVWGVKSRNIVGAGTQPPSTLFRVSAFGGPLFVVGQVTLGGNDIDVDALAMDSMDELYGFEVISDGASSRLITINLADAAATVVGLELPGRNIRGATITAGGRFLAIDTASSELLEIDRDSGLAVGPGIELTLGGTPLALSHVTDLVEDGAGGLILVDHNVFYALEEGSGELEHLYTDMDPGPDGRIVYHVGLARETEDLRDAQFVAYDGNGTDDIFAYSADGNFARTEIALHIIPEYNAGGGDLASVAVPSSDVEETGSWGSIKAMYMRP